MRITREDAARLINDLPKVIKEISKEEFRRVSGKELKENNYPINNSYIKLLKTYEYNEIPKNLSVQEYLNWVTKNKH